MSKLDDLVSSLRAGERLAAARVRETERANNDAQRELDLIVAKLQGVLEAVRLVEAPTPSRDSDKAKRRSRSLSGHWKKIMQMVYGSGSFDYDDLAMTADLLGHSVGRDTLRSQMSLYKGAGLVEVAEAGKFRLTEAGIKAADIGEISKAPGVEAPGASNGRVAELEGPRKTEQHPIRIGEHVGSSPTPPTLVQADAYDVDLDDDVPF